MDVAFTVTLRGLGMLLRALVALLFKHVSTFSFYRGGSFFKK